jgi:hypothetical protein
MTLVSAATEHCEQLHPSYIYINIYRERSVVNEDVINEFCQIFIII